MMLYPIINEKIRTLPLYVTGIGTQEKQEATNRPNGFKDSHICIVSEGHGVLEIGSKVYPLKKGSCFYFQKNLPHKYYSPEGFFENKWITFAGDKEDEILHALGFGRHLVFQLPDPSQLLTEFETLFSIIQKNGHMSLERACAVLYQYLTDFAYTVSRQQTHDEKLKPVLSYMQENYSRDITLEELAGTVNLSPYTLCRNFHLHYGMSVFSYLTQIRIQNAKVLLTKEWSIKIKEVAIRTGFKSTSYFCAVFKKLEGITPQKFRAFS